MDDFETFKASREKMDPGSRSLSEQQWTQAYSAYRSARQRVGGSSSTSKEGKTSRRRRSKSAASAGGAQSPSSVSDPGQLRHAVRKHSAYADLRLTVDILAWVAIGLVALAAIVRLFDDTSVPTAMIALLAAGVQLIGIVLARLVVAVLIDIPDIALYRCLREPAPTAPHDAAAQEKTQKTESF